MSNGKRFFCVTSHGWSASRWIAYSLNAHPDVVCTHSARNLLANSTDINNNEDLKQNLDQLYKGYLNRQELSLDQNYDQIEQLGVASFYGSVHLYRLRDFPYLHEKYGPFSRSLQVGNVIRNPITLVWSGYGEFYNLFRFDLNELYWNLGKLLSDSKDFVLHLIKKYSLNIGEYHNLAFICAARVLESLRKDLDALEEVNDIPLVHFMGNYRMESITSDKEAFQDFFSSVVGAAPDEQYLNMVHNKGAINEHRKDKRRLSGKERYFRLEAWQQEVLNHFLNKYRILEPYEDLGYDLSFIRETSNE